MVPTLAKRRASMDFVEEALYLIGKAKEKNIILRLMGSCAIRVHTHQDIPLLDAMKKERKLTDIDLMTYGKFAHKLDDFFSEEGYTPYTRFNVIYAGKQLRYFDATNTGRFVDVFLNKLAMSHTVNFENRLEVEYPTIPLAELLLEKMQIVKINEKDIKDAMLLLRGHEIGNGDNETINAKHIAKLLAKDWGFYYTVNQNLNKIKNWLDKYEWLSKEDRRDIASKVDKLLDVIESEPKTTGWKLRAKIGTRKKWYTDVEEIGG
jgi:hypothetical protein